MTTAVLKRTFFALPVLGWVAHDIAERDHENIWYAILAFVSLVGCATVIWGLPALGLIALAMVPVVMIVLIGVTLG